MIDKLENLEKLNESVKRRRLCGRIAAAVTAVAVLAACLVPVLAEIEWPTKIDRFERYDPVYDESVELGTALEDLDLPEYLRAVISLGELDLDSSTFVQAQPEADTSDGYTHYDYYYYGYVAPADADALYESGELAVYTIYYAAQDGSGTVGETAYRVYGSINGSQNVWFACDEAGEIMDVILDVPVTWSGDYDPDTPGEYTFTADFEEYTYRGSNPTAVITVYDSTESDTEEEEETAVACTCGLGTEEYSAEHDADCPYYCYEEEEEILCTCDVQTNDMGADHASDCPMYIAELAECHCGTDGEAIAENNYPWQHNEDCAYFSPIECVCREQVEVTEAEDVDGTIEWVTSVVPGDFTHEHDPENTDCPLYGSATVTVEKQDATTLSARLMGGTTSVMSVEDAEEILAYQEETGSAMYSALGMISVVEGSEQSAAASVSTLSVNGGGNNDLSMDADMISSTPTSGNSSYTSDYTGSTVIPGTWVDYVNTIWMNKAYNAFAWTADSDTGAYNNWAWSGVAANSNSGTVTSNALKIPTRSSAGVWVVYSGEQLLYAMNNFTSGDTIRLGGNLNMNGDDYSWTTVAVSGRKSLTIDGNGYTIYNLGNYTTVTSTNNYANFLANITDGLTITDLTFATAKFVNTSGGNHTAILRLVSSGTDGSQSVLTNVTVRDSMFYSNGLDSNGEQAGHLVSTFGRVAPSGTGMTPVITNCYSTDNFVYGRDHISGFGFGAGNNNYIENESKWGQFTNCYTVGNLICGTGGHSAGFSSCNGEGANYESCFAVNEMYGSAAVGGFLGGTMAHATNCYSSGKLEGYAVLGGFAFSYTGSFTQSVIRTFTNCYSTVLIGLRTNPTRQGGFSAAMVHLLTNEDFDPTVSLYHYEVQTNCYAAGEVGNFDLDMENPQTVGGYLDVWNYTNQEGHFSLPSGLFTFTNCYYDKQTTAMREWAAGDSQSVDGVTGVLTTELTSADFNGFTNMSDWVIDDEEQHYPQLSVFANAAAGDWGSQEVASLVQAYSLASTSTVFLDEWETGYTWTDLGVRSETEVAWDTPGSGSDNAGAVYTYDTVREIVSDFTVTAASVWTEQITGGAPTLVEDAEGSESVENQTITIDNDTATGTVVNPGMNWYDIEAAVNGVTASRPIRLIAYMTIEAGENETVSSGDYYDHRNGVLLTMVDSLTEDLVVGLHDEEPWSTSVQQEWPAAGDGSEEPSDAYYGVQTESTAFSASEGAIINTEIWLAELDTGGDGGTVIYDEPGTDAEYYYDADSGGYLKAQMDVRVTGEGSTDSLAARKFRGDIPLYPDTSSGRKYIISYYWILEDGRYITDYKVVSIEPGYYSVDMYVYNYLDGSENSSLLYLDVAADLTDGSFGYDVSSGTTASTASLPYNAESRRNAVKYTTNVTAAWRKSTAETSVRKILIELYYRDGTLAGSAEVEGDIEDGQQITIPTLLYYYLEVVEEGGADREDTLSQIVDVTYTVTEVKDENGAGTGEYYLRFNKIINAPEDEWVGAFSPGDDSTGMALPADSEDEEIEAYINDLQFDTVITLWVSAVIDYELPEVGGTGNTPYIIGGTAFTAAAVIGGIMLRCRRRGKEDRSV